MPRKKFVCGNWKLNKTVAESTALAEAVRNSVEADDLADRVDVAVAPVFVSLGAVADVLRGGPVRLAAQNGFWEPGGAFTGEVSFRLLKDVGCTHVIVGHSERRQLFGETDQTVNRRVRAALAEGLTPILCVGETIEQRQKGTTEEVVKTQLLGGLHGLGPEEVGWLTLAYEPVWAIGTGHTATPEQAQQVHAFIRELVAGRAGAEVAERIRIQYGGSVKPANAAELMGCRDIDGALVGGASLDAESFAGIIRGAASAG